MNYLITHSFSNVFTTSLSKVRYYWEWRHQFAGEDYLLLERHAYHPKIRAVTLFLVIVLFASISNKVIASYAPETGTTKSTSVVSTINLSYDENLLSAKIENVGLASVLAALAQETETTIEYIDPYTQGLRVSTKLQAVSLENGLRDILKNLSYILYLGDKIYSVQMLSMDRGSMPTAEDTAIVRPEHSLLSDDTNPNAPLSLDEFEPLKFADLPSSISDDDGVDDSVDESREQEHNQALLERALSVLESEHANLYAEAFDQLADIEDESALDALTQAVLGNTEITSETRLQAVDALTRRALNSESFETSSNDVLNQLASDQDENVRALARQAQKDINQRQE
ncbi:MAG: hypothetical protein V3U88_13085 [Methylococcales bacterium]